MGLPAQATELDSHKVETAKASTDTATDVAVNNATFTVQADAKVDFKRESFTAKAAPEPVVEVPVVEADDATGTTASNKSTTSTTSRSTGHSSTSASRSTSRSEAPVPTSVKGGSIISIAKRYTGVPYVSGGKTPSGWDCSGYVSYVYRQAGISIPSQSTAIRNAGRVVSASEARPGDVIWHPGHVGIYAGGGMMYDAGNSRVDTTYRSFSWMGNVTFLRFS